MSNLIPKRVANIIAIDIGSTIHADWIKPARIYPTKDTAATVIA